MLYLLYSESGLKNSLIAVLKTGAGLSLRMIHRILERPVRWKVFACFLPIQQSMIGRSWLSTVHASINSKMNPVSLSKLHSLSEDEQEKWMAGCLCSVALQVLFTVDDQTSTTHCRHFFHARCLHKVVESSDDLNEDGSIAPCSQCRTSISTSLVTGVRYQMLS